MSRTTLHVMKGKYRKIEDYYPEKLEFYFHRYNSERAYFKQIKMGILMRDLSKRDFQELNEYHMNHNNTYCTTEQKMLYL